MPATNGLTKEEKRALLVSWQEARDAVEVAETRVQTTIAAIYEKIGTGPFRYDGVLYIVRKGSVKDPNHYAMVRRENVAEEL